MEMQPVTKYRAGFLGAWAFFVITSGFFGLAVAGETENVADERWLTRLSLID